MAPRLRNIKSKLPSADIGCVKAAPKRADAIFSTAEYKQWREAVIKRARGRCEYPGCGRTHVRLFADHIVERQDGGALFDPANGQALCGQHHSLKTAAERARRLSRQG